MFTTIMWNMGGAPSAAAVSRLRRRSQHHCLGSRVCFSTVVAALGSESLKAMAALVCARASTVFRRALCYSFPSIALLLHSALPPMLLEATCPLLPRHTSISHYSFFSGAMPPRGCSRCADVRLPSLPGAVASLPRLPDDGKRCPTRRGLAGVGDAPPPSRVGGRPPADRICGSGAFFPHARTVSREGAMATVGPAGPTVARREGEAAAGARPAGAEPAAERARGPRLPALAALGRDAGEPSRGGRGRGARPRPGVTAVPKATSFAAAAGCVGGVGCACGSGIVGAAASLMATAPADSGRRLEDASAYLLAGLASASAAAAATSARKASTLVFMSLLSWSALAVALCMVAMASRTRALRDCGSFSAAAVGVASSAPAGPRASPEAGAPCAFRALASSSKPACSFLKSERSSKCSEKSRSICRKGGGGGKGEG